MCETCNNQNELYDLEKERLFNKISHFFEIKNEVATDKAILLALQISHDGLIDVNETIEMMKLSNTILNAEEIEDEIAEYLEDRTEHISLSIMDIAYFIYSFNTITAIPDLPEYYMKYSETFLSEILDITNNVNKI